MKNVLFVATYPPDSAPAQRFRFELFLDYLERNGFACTYSPLLSPRDSVWFYGDSYLRKGLLLPGTVLRRSRDLLQARTYDIIFIQREAYILGTTLFERGFKKAGAKIVFDFDDAIWLNAGVSANNTKLAWLKRPEKTREIIELSDMVFAGNPYLASYASRYNDTVKIVPTVIDTDTYQPVPTGQDSGRICIGWSGSFSTIVHFEHAIGPLMRLQKRFGDRITFRVIGDGNYRHQPLGIEGQPWRRETEVADLSAIDIGIMPLPDDEWSRGKCGLKGLQYMSLGIPTVMSPVGVNAEIIQDGENGFLAGSEEEWVEKISRLIVSAELRRRLGEAGRQTVLKHYSVRSQRDRILAFFHEVLGEKVPHATTG